MALRHRQNPNQRQRIVVFVASPLQTVAITPDLEELIASLKKNSVRVNFVSLGTESLAANQPLLESIVAKLEEGASSESDVPGSSVLGIPVGESVLEHCRREAALTGQSSSGGEASMLMDGDDMDPELAMALKLSLEEEQQRQAKAQDSSASTQATSSQSSTQRKTSNKRTAEEEDDSMDEEMRMAIELSLQDQKKP